MSPYRIVLADDHALFLEGLKKVLHGAGDLEFVGQAVEGVELLDIVKKDPVFPSFILLHSFDHIKMVTSLD
jgi:DNA-binding NarL/FixJ family response regulator